MSLEAGGDTVLVPCRGCQRDVILPSGPVRATMRAGRRVVVFCSQRCQKRTIGREGAKQQDVNLARRARAVSPPEPPASP